MIPAADLRRAVAAQLAENPTCQICEAEPAAKVAWIEAERPDVWRARSVCSTCEILVQTAPAGD